MPRSDPEVSTSETFRTANFRGNLLASMDDSQTGSSSRHRAYHSATIICWPTFPGPKQYFEPRQHLIRLDPLGRPNLAKFYVSLCFIFIYRGTELKLTSSLCIVPFVHKCVVYHISTDKALLLLWCKRWKHWPTHFFSCSPPLFFGGVITWTLFPHVHQPRICVHNESGMEVVISQWSLLLLEHEKTSLDHQIFICIVDFTHAIHFSWSAELFFTVSYWPHIFWVAAFCSIHLQLISNGGDKEPSWTAIRQNKTEPVCEKAKKQSRNRDTLRFDFVLRGTHSPKKKKKKNTRARSSIRMTGNLFLEVLFSTLLTSALDVAEEWTDCKHLHENPITCK